MKYGDLVDTPHGLGRFAFVDEADPTIGLVRLKKPAEGHYWHPIAQIERQAFIDCLPFNKIPLEKITLVKNEKAQNEKPKENIPDNK